jgi:hypothetical protein
MTLHAARPCPRAGDSRGLVLGAGHEPRLLQLTDVDRGAEGRAGEWSVTKGSFELLDRGSVIEAPTLRQPLRVAALLDAAEADNAVARALVARSNPVIEGVRAERRKEGLREGKSAALLAILAARGLAVGEDEHGRRPQRPETAQSQENRAPAAGKRDDPAASRLPKRSVRPSPRASLFLTPRKRPGHGARWGGTARDMPRRGPIAFRTAPPSLFPSGSAHRPLATASARADPPLRQRSAALRPDALTACGRIFVEQIARFPEAQAAARGKSPWAAEVSGFDVHAGVTVRAGDREGLERLFRDGARALQPRAYRALARRPRRLPPAQAAARRRDAPRARAATFPGAKRVDRSPSSLSVAPPLGRVRAALAVANVGACRAGPWRAERRIRRRGHRRGEPGSRARPRRASRRDPSRRGLHKALLLRAGRARASAPAS